MNNTDKRREKPMRDSLTWQEFAELQRCRVPLDVAFGIKRCASCGDWVHLHYDHGKNLMPCRFSRNGSGPCGCPLAVWVEGRVVPLNFE